jgi:hypothetical protein
MKEVRILLVLITLDQTVGIHTNYLDHKRLMACLIPKKLNDLVGMTNTRTTQLKYFYFDYQQNMKTYYSKHIL